MGLFTQLLRSVFDLSKRNFTELWTKTFISQNILYVVLGSVALYRLTCCRRTMRKGFLWNYIEPTFNHSVNTSQRNLEEAYSLIIAIDQTLITLFMQRLLEDILIWVLRIWKITGRGRNWKSLHFEQQPNQLHGRHLYLSYLSSKIEMTGAAGRELKVIHWQLDPFPILHLHHYSMSSSSNISRERVRTFRATSLCIVHSCWQYESEPGFKFKI